MPESDSEFLDMMWGYMSSIRRKDEHYKRLFSLARRGAAMQAAGWQRRLRDGNAPTIEAEWTLCHTREATDPFARVPGFEYRPIFALARRGAAMQASKGEQRTICEACGNSNLAHDRAAWTDDGTSFCPSCLPPPPAGETNE